MQKIDISGSPTELLKRARSHLHRALVLLDVAGAADAAVRVDDALVLVQRHLEAKAQASPDRSDLRDDAG